MAVASTRGKAAPEPGRPSPTERLLRLVRLDAAPRDGVGDAALRGEALVVWSAVIAVVATVWVATYAALGLWPAAAIPALYQLLTVAGLLRIRAGGSLERYRRVQLTAMLVLPFLLQWTLGGAVPSGAVMLWGLFTPLGALVICGRRVAGGFLAAFLALAVVSGLLEPVLPLHVVPVADIPGPVSLGFFVLNTGVVGCVAFGVLSHFIEARREALEALEAERGRSERLLHAILPHEIAARLKRGETAIADRHGEASVLFADLVGFTALAARTPADEIVALLNEVFAAFDRLAEARGVETIKTLGDGYLAVAGLPHERPGHADAVARLALDLREGLARIARGHGADLSVRIGIDSGPVVAGVIGRRRFGYDVWGDTVNTAGRMQALAPPGGIYLTERAARLLSDGFRAARQPERPVKGKGVLAPYSLEGER